MRILIVIESIKSELISVNIHIYIHIMREKDIIYFVFRNKKGRAAKKNHKVNVERRRVERNQKDL